MQFFLHIIVSIFFLLSALCVYTSASPNYSCWQTIYIYTRCVNFSFKQDQEVNNCCCCVCSVLFFSLTAIDD